MGLDLELVARGRKASAIEIGEPEALTESEAVMYATNSVQAEFKLKKITDRHHMVARLLAGGTTEGDVAAITGFDNSRISILKNDPAFKELLAFYREGVNEQYADLHEHLAGMSKDALLELRERLEESPQDFSITALLEIVKSGADRTGHGPTSSHTQNVNINIADRLAAARNRLEQAKLING